MERPTVGVLGATSLVAGKLLPLLDEAYSVVALGRNETTRGILDKIPEDIPYWITLIPLWALPNYCAIIASRGARRIVALSSTSVLTKATSSNGAEKALAHRLREAERSIIDWAERQKVEWILLRPTLIYGVGRDRNICYIARFIRYSGFFPVLGSASGLRQPIYVEDVALACKQALEAKNIANAAYNISGGEIMTYREMVHRIFKALGRTPRIIRTPRWLFRTAIAWMRMFPRLSHLSTAMVDRMNVDLVFDHSAAAEGFGFRPRRFELSERDLPDRGSAMAAELLRNATRDWMRVVRSR